MYGCLLKYNKIIKKLNEMKIYKNIHIMYSIFFILLWSSMLFSCREDETASTTSKDALQVYLQAGNNKDQALISSPVPILQGKFMTDNSDLFFAVATRKSQKTHYLQ
jgi:hypothetical protein